MKAGTAPFTRHSQLPSLATRPRCPMQTVLGPQRRSAAAAPAALRPAPAAGQTQTCVLNIDTEICPKHRNRHVS